jgi:hypothetical protein
MFPKFNPNVTTLPFTLPQTTMHAKFTRLKIVNDYCLLLCKKLTPLLLNINPYTILLHTCYSWIGTLHTRNVHGPGTAVRPWQELSRARTLQGPGTIYIFPHMYLNI